MKAVVEANLIDGSEGPAISNATIVWAAECVGLQKKVVYKLLPRRPSR